MNMMTVSACCATYGGSGRLCSWGLTASPCTRRAGWLLQSGHGAAATLQQAYHIHQFKALAFSSRTTLVQFMQASTELMGLSLQPLGICASSSPAGSWHTSRPCHHALRLCLQTSALPPLQRKQALLSRRRHVVVLQPAGPEGHPLQLVVKIKPHTLSFTALAAMLSWLAGWLQ